MIKVLDEKLVNKIAAGEVIEKPVNVVKELIENSLDAGADDITIEVKENLIRIQDNGCGMSKEDLILCLKRHATSKIASFDDLENVRSMGFRGEALSSIASVSDITIVSKQKGAMEGGMVHVEYGFLRESKTVGASEGTKIEVRDLFHNTPVRKKFLDAKESERIVECVMKIALGNEDVRFKLVKDDEIIFDVYKGSLLDRVVGLYGSEFVKDLVEIDFEDKGIRVSGYVSKPSLLRKDKSMQSFFVNNRLVDGAEASSALYDAYKSLLFVNRHPVVVLNLYMQGVDVNVHPTKSEIRFENPNLVYKVVFDAIRSVFQEEEMVFDVQDKFDFGQPEKKVVEEKVVEVSNQQGLVESSSEEGFIRLPKLKLLGCVGKTYWIAESSEGLLLIDQHVVQEKVLYEKFMKQFVNNSVEVQELLNADVMELDPKNACILRANLERFGEFGFKIEEFGGDSFLVRSVPIIFGDVFGKELLLDLFVDMKSVVDYKEKVVTRMACRASIKAGDEVSEYRLMSLLKELDKCELPYTCPHGRPIIVKLSISDLEKMFRRKV
tara:strand:+ start:184 stop:1836 length:1653 start_codon:yes stop_codon:yes gene_type:complete